ncbi:unnamed protein product [Caenorhabditis auriculariae]|uniref:Uncharacterized protein n=1 Tax=Caenorhabditis auriculariae TaxID=2777116 RepID=A0A8S1H8Z5_9PELO|nr:unnamed protein product [Caenorhabditis auriculariae]
MDHIWTYHNIVGLTLGPSCSRNEADRRGEGICGHSCFRDLRLKIVENHGFIRRATKLVRGKLSWINIAGKRVGGRGQECVGIF